MKKGQAALEFLTTYGWAFLVILVMIGALAYFGVLSPNSLKEAQCVLNPQDHDNYEWCQCDNITESTIRMYVDVPKENFINNCIGEKASGASCVLGTNQTGTFTLYTEELGGADIWVDFRWELSEGVCTKAHIIE